MEKKNEELKDQYEKSDHPWKNFHHNRCEWRKNREGNEDSSFWKNWKEKKVIEIENLKKDKTFEKEITFLNSNGYTDEFLNYRLLQRYGGNVKRVISKIIKKNNRKEKGYNWRKHLKGEKTEVKNEQQEKNVVCNEICDNVEIKQDHPKLDQNIDQLEDKSEKT